jgi:hypothetical protein
MEIFEAVGAAKALTVTVTAVVAELHPELFAAT